MNLHGLTEAMTAQGSTRQLGLMRIALSWLLWGSWGYPLVLHFDIHPERVALALAFYVCVWVMFLGIYSRVFSLLTGMVLVLASILLGDPLRWTIWAEQHRQLTVVLTLALALTPAGTSFSLDRWRALRRAAARGEPVPAEHGELWGLWLLRCLATAVFAVTTLSQANPEWLSGELIRRTLLDGVASEGAYDGPWAPALAWLILAVHAFVTVGLWFARTRWVAIALGGGCHLLLFLVLPISTLPLIVCWMLFAFVPSERVHSAIDRLHGRQDARERPRTIQDARDEHPAT